MSDTYLAVTLSLGMAAGCASTQSTDYVRNCSPQQMAEALRPSVSLLAQIQRASAHDMTPELATELGVLLDQIISTDGTVGTGPVFPGETSALALETNLAVSQYRLAVEAEKEACEAPQTDQAYHKRCVPAQQQRISRHNIAQHQMKTLRRVVNGPGHHHGVSR